MAWNVGVLIIGSLLWESEEHLDKESGKIRKLWRDEELLAPQMVPVSVPLRYGRVSKSRGCCFTMVLDPGCEEGSAWVLPLKSPIDSVEELVAAAKAMARAEGLVIKRTNEVRTCLSWGMISLVTKTENTLTNEQLKTWKSAIITHEKTIEKLKSNCPMATASGLLRESDWPKFTDPAHDTFELLLVALTAPTPPFPSSSEIARAILRDGTDKGREYFNENNRNGIVTFQDSRIIGHLWGSPGNDGGDV